MPFDTLQNLIQYISIWLCQLHIVLSILGTDSEQRHKGIITYNYSGDTLHIAYMPGPYMYLASFISGDEVERMNI